MIEKRRFARSVALIMILFFISGCSFVFHKRSPADTRRIDELEGEVSKLQRELGELEAIKRSLEKRLRDEITKGELDLKVEERGLVITSLAEVYFDSGKAKIRPEAEAVLKKITFAVKELGGGRQIGVEGHTDNEPIKHSGWKSNQHLSEARAESVANFLKKEGISSSSIVTEGYGETRPVASNDTKEGRQKNRRVEIIILARETSRSSGRTGRGTIK